MNTKLSSHQIKVLKLLACDNYIVTNEGHGFKAWMEDSSGQKLDIKVRVDTCNIFYTHKLIEFASVHKKISRIYYYTLSEEGKRVIKNFKS